MAIAASRPTLFLIAGPNGAGKSTFYDTVLHGRIAAPFVNADIIQRDELENPSPEAAYEAAEIAEARRREFLTEGRSFVMETVFSHPSKMALIQDARIAAYRIVVFHLMLQSADLAVARVKQRAKEGGHAVPERKVRERFGRNSALIKQAVLLADRAQVLNGSALNERPKVVLELANGRMVKQTDSLPNWIAMLYADVI